MSKLPKMSCNLTINHINFYFTLNIEYYKSHCPTENEPPLSSKKFLITGLKIFFFGEARIGITWMSWESPGPNGISARFV